MLKYAKMCSKKKKTRIFNHISVKRILCLRYTTVDQKVYANSYTSPSPNNYCTNLL